MGQTEGHFPKQNIPDSKKTPQWCKENILAMLAYQNYTTKFNRERKKDYENYLIFNGVFDTKQFEYITNTYGISSPARFVNFPLIHPKIENVVGEFMSNEMQFTVDAVNEDAINRKLDKKIQLVAEKLLAPIRQEASQALDIEFEAEDYGMEIPDDIDKFMQMNFREASEDVIYNGIEYLMQKYQLQHTFKQGLYDNCITSKEFYHVGIKNGNPFARRVDPRALIWDIGSETESLQDSEWVAEERFLTVSEIIDEFGDYLTPETVSKIEKLRYEGQDTLQRYNKPYQWYYKDDSLTPLRIRVVTGVWKSLRTMKFKISENKHDSELPFRKLLPEDYKIRKGDKVEKKTVIDIWQTTMIGHEILVNARRMPNQIRRGENYAEAPLPYVGVIKNNIDSITLSIVDILKNVQILYNIVMFHIELSLARSGGKAVVYDVAQKPNGITLDDVFYHAKNSGIIPINAKQEGGQINTFNQFQQIDFTLSNSVQQLMNLKIMLEQTAERLTGITDARAGLTKTDAVGVNERNVMQSSLITQPIFANHTRCIEMVLQQMSDLMKIAWKPGMKQGYVLGDAGIRYLEVTKDFDNDDMAIFVKNSVKNKQEKDTILQIGQQILSGAGAQGFLQLIKVMNADSSKEAEVILEQGIEAIISQQEAQQEQMMQIEQQKAQATQQAAEMKYRESQEANQTKIEGHKIDANAAIEVAKIKVDGGQETQDFRQQHDKDMAMLNTSNDMAKQGATADREYMNSLEKQSASPNNPMQ
jgi:hypothetical protein